MQQQTWQDESAFLSADARRWRSDEVDLGATWRGAGSPDGATWRLAWLRETGELYAVRSDSMTGTGSSPTVLALVPDERTLDLLLDGWREARLSEDGLRWLDARLHAGSAAA